MTASLRKEFRPLLLPWWVAVGCVALASALSQIAGAGEFESFLISISKLTFPGALILLASSSFGIELQQHTLPLLLSQPVDRTRVWAEKMFVLVVSIGTAVLVAAVFLVLLSLGRIGEPLFETKDVVLFGIFLLGTICSCGFWTLVAGSSLGGFVFTIAGQFITGAAVAGTVAWIRGEDQAFEDSQTFPALAVAGLVYSAVFLWLGWRRFVRLEVRSTRFGQTMAQSGIATWNLPWAGMFVSRPGEKVRNLIRKELRLERTIFLLAAVFVVCWLATGLLQWLRPKQNIIYVFDVMSCLYAPLAALLAGCVPLGEEKALGLTAAQLTLPFSQRAQWLVKLAVGAGTAAVLGLVLPFSLFLTTGMLFDVSTSGLMNPNEHGLEALAIVSGLAFLAGHWAISMTPNTVRGALVAVCALIGLVACGALGAWFGQLSSGWQSGILVTIMCHLQSAPDVFQQQAGRIAGSILWCLTAGIVLLSLFQSLIQFRKSVQNRHQLLIYSLALGTLVIGLIFCSMDFDSSARRLPDSSPIRELRSGLGSFFSRNAQTQSQEERVVTAQELEERMRFSDLTRIWLRNTKISCRFLPARPSNSNTLYPYNACISFPTGEKFSFEGAYAKGPHLIKGDF